MHMPWCVYVCVLSTPMPLAYGGGCVDYETHRDLIPTGSGCISLSPHLGFCSLLWNSRNGWTFIQSLHASVNRTSGRLKKLPFVTWYKDALILQKPYIEYRANGERAKVQLKKEFSTFHQTGNSPVFTNVTMSKFLMKYSSRLSF